MTSTKFSFVAGLLLTAFANSAISQGDRGTIAVLERDPLMLDLTNGGIVRVFHGPKNEEYEIRMLDWPKMEYYYIPELALKKMTDGSFAEVRQVGDEVTIAMQIVPRNPDAFELFESIHRAVNPKA